MGDTVPIIADGGVRDDKDLFLALICGASSVMLGDMLSTKWVRPRPPRSRGRPRVRYNASRT
ncbi:MAG: IMP dehydrogenase [Candidatus Rokubacteria bacterium]|nr:IMP dehydrogenase [Candidatus Rokubacteria bacterium]